MPEMIPDSPSILTTEIVRSRRRTVELEIVPDGSLLVRAPLRASRGEIDRIVAGKRLWIQRKRQQLQSARRRLGADASPAGKTLFFLGQAYPLEISCCPERPFFFTGTGFLLDGRAWEECRHLIELWYREASARIISERVAHFALTLRMSVPPLRISGAHMRWGSCSRFGVLRFSWRLAMAPLEAIDYVVVHELAHLRVKSHGRRFWSRVEAMLPSYRQPRSWLRENGFLLTIP